MSSGLKLGFFGGFRAEAANGKALAFTSRKGQALLGYLAVESARPQSRERLASLLWGNTGEERARHNLRQAIARIRQAFGDIIAADGDCILLGPAQCATDVGEFARLAGAEDVGSLRRKLDLYQGDLLAGIEPREPEFSDWLQLTRSRLRQEACETAARLTDSLVSVARRDEAIDALRDLLAIDPADENAHRKLMRLYADCGRRSEALRQYQRCRDALRRELGTDPDADTRSLAMSLQRQPEAASPVIASSVPSVAVLPFDNLSGSEAGYFVDGIVEDLITALSCFDSLAVIARGSTFNYRDGTVPDKVIAQELGAQFLVRGSVQRAGNRVRINAQLMDAEAGLQIWGHRYDREMEDVFALQDEITATLVSTLAGRVEAARLSHARKAPAERLDAYDLVLRGKDHHHRFTAEDCAACIDMFRRAIERDPSYAVAHAWLACGYGQAMVFRLDDRSKLVDLSQAAAEKGLELDDNEAEAHRVLAQVQLTRRNLERALWHQNRALFLNPNDDRVLCAQGEILTFVGKAAEGEQWVRKALRLNPWHPERYWTHLARALFHLGRFDETIAALDNISRQRMDDLAYRVAASYLAGNALGAAQAGDQLRKAYPDFDPEAFVAALPYTSADYRDELRAPLGRVFARQTG